MLQSWEYRQGQRRLIAVANYWQRGECFAVLSFGGVRRGGRYVLREPLRQRVFGSEDGSAELDGKALREGVRVHVGAQRFAFFVVEPAGEAPPASPVVRPSEVAATQATRRPAIQSAFATEKDERGMADFAKLFGRIQRLRTDDIAVERTTNRALKRDTLCVTTPSQSLDVDVLGGGGVRSWIVGGTEFVSKDKACGLGLDALSHPAKMLTGPMEFVSRDVRDGKARIVLRHPAIDGLPGLELEKRFEIDVRSTAFRVRTVMRNGGDAAVEFSHRYHSMPVALERPDGVSGTATFDGREPARFTRTFKRHMYLFDGAPADNLLTKAFDMGQTSTIEGTRVTFGAPWLPRSAVAELDGKALHSVVFWDSQEMTCATFEPIHSRVTLEPGTEWTTGMRWVSEDR